MTKQMPPKDPDSKLDYKIDWERWLDGDTIQTSTWIVPTGLTKENETNDTKTATVWLSGGVLGQMYVITNHITTAGGRIQDASFKLKVEEL